MNKMAIYKAQEKSTKFFNFFSKKGLHIKKKYAIIISVNR